MALLVETYCDESGTHDGAVALCVAGYVFTKSGAINLTRQWNEILNWPELPEPLPYFHMSECAPDPGFGPFKALTKDQRIEVVRRCIEAIKQNAIQGLCVTLDYKAFDRVMTAEAREFVGSAYSHCVNVMLGGIDGWAAANPHVDQIAYFFEAGHPSASESARIMEKLFKYELASPKSRFGGYSFIPKRGNPCVQAADLLAWYGNWDRANAAGARRPMRKDFVSLLELHHSRTHVGEEQFQTLMNDLRPLLDEMPPST